MPSIRLTRQQLYDRVWATAIDTLCQQLGLSGRGLGKLCAREGIPVPPRGYWAKKAAGKRVHQTLPARAAGTHAVLSFNVLAEDDASSAEPTTEHPLITYERTAANRIVVPDDLPATDERLLKTQSLLARAKRNAEGIVMPPAAAFHIQTSPTQHDKALRLMQALLTAFEARGFAVVRGDEGYRVQVLDEALGFGIEEELTTVEHRISFTEQKLIDRGLGWQVPRETKSLLVI